MLLPPVQNKLKSVAVSVMQDQLLAEVSIGQFTLGFPKKLNVEDILITKPGPDTLFYLSKFSVNIALLPLLKHQLVIKSIELKQGKGDFGKLMAQMPPDTASPAPETTEEKNGQDWEYFLQCCRQHYKSAGCQY
jgi:hypothetical protein